MQYIAITKDDLAHSGVIGMHWGTRRGPKSESSSNVRKAAKQERKIKIKEEYDKVTKSSTKKEKFLWNNATRKKQLNLL